MLRLIILIIIINASTGSEDDENSKDIRISVLRKFHDQYFKTIESPNDALVSWFIQDYQHTVPVKNSNIIHITNFVHDGIYFLRNGLKTKSKLNVADIELIVDMYVKYLAMWTSLMFKVCAILPENTNVLDKTDAALIIPQDCYVVSTYMAWFHSVYINEITEKRSIRPHSPFDERIMKTFTLEEIKMKLDFINAVTNLIHFTFNPETLDHIIPKIYLTKSFTPIKETLEKKNTHLLHKSLRNDYTTKTPTSIFQDDTYQQIWLRLLDLYDSPLIENGNNGESKFYGEPIIDVENYFASMFRDKHYIHQVTELIPPRSTMIDICKRGTEFSEFLLGPSFGLFDSDNVYGEHFDKGGRILMFIESIKKDKKIDFDKIPVPNLVLRKAGEDSVADYKVYIDSEDNE